MVFKPSVIQPLYVQCFHFVKNKAYKMMLQYSSYYIGFFDYDMSYIVALFICLLFTTCKLRHTFPTALSAPPPPIPYILIRELKNTLNELLYIVLIYALQWF